VGICQVGTLARIQILNDVVLSQVLVRVIPSRT